MEILLVIFAIIIVGFLVIDLGYFNRQAHKVSSKSALIQSLFWVAISLLYGLAIWQYVGHELAAEFLSAYAAEKMLSVDNLFVIMLIFSYFKIEPKYHHRVLFWGIMGAIVFRGIFLTVGTYLVHQFHWILYIFGVFLVYTGIKLFLDKGDEEVDFENNKVLKLARRFLPLWPNKWHGGQFWIILKGKLYFTALFLVLILIEVTDIIFAFDSIPAVLAISQNPFVVFTSNVFAIMGLRALFFLIQDFLGRFEHLQKGISFVLIFIGAKMIADIFNIHISSLVSLGVIIVTLGLSLWLSVLFPSKSRV